MDKSKIINLFKNYELISLGYSCYPALFIKDIIKKETNFFDNIGSSSWSIKKILDNNFKDVLNKKKFIYLNKIFKKHDHKYNIINKEYYLRFIHDNDFLKNEKEWNNFKNKYLRRIIRFNNLLKSNKNLLFIYLEENLIERFDNLYNDIKKYYPESKNNYNIEQSKLEKDNMNKISIILKKKYNKNNFKIIYFSHFIEKSYYENNIIFIKTDFHYNLIEWNEWSEKQCMKSILDNYDFINEHLFESTTI
jgi:hypothetical protein